MFLPTGATSSNHWLMATRALDKAGTLGIMSQDDIKGSMKGMDEKLKSVEQAADYFGVKARQIRRWIHDGKIEITRLASGGVRFTQEQLDRFTHCELGESKYCKR